ncbi:MAG TPA: ABC transporter permease [Microbacteriaceae bacterium]|nr:ABC transporter permease [Microbacteriaceae bacterium]
MSATTAPVTQDRPEGVVGALRRAASLQRQFPILQVIAVVLIYVVGAVTLPGFASFQALQSILVLAALAGLASLGQTMLIIMGGFDLSVSGFIVAGALAATSLATIYQVDVGVALGITVLAAALIGAAAGFICHRFDIPPLVVTLGTGAIALGAMQIQTGGALAGSAPQWLSSLSSPIQSTFGIPFAPVVVIWFIVIIAAALFLHRTVWGRHILATGANPEAATNARVNTRMVWTLVFAFSAVMSVLVGVLLAGFSGSVDSTLGNPYLFQSVATVVVGGTVFGGPGDYTRTVIGTLFLSVLMIVLIGHGADTSDQQLLYGVIILLAVTLYGRQRRIRDLV